MREACFGLALAAGLLMAVPTAAHHSFGQFDGTRKIKIEGTVSSYQWSNPHVWIQVRVMENGQEKEWSIECPAIAGLQRVGWTSKSLKKGDKITAYIHPLRAGGPGGALATVTKADGTQLGETEIQKRRDESGS